MIVQICGTNASGKTTVMRKLLAFASAQEPVTENNKIMGYNIILPEVTAPVRVIGPYGEAATGGCDRLGGRAEDFYAYVESLWHDNPERHILFEGIRVMNHTRGIALQRATQCMHIVRLMTPFPEVMASLSERREAAGNTRELKSIKDIESNMVRAKNYALKIYDVGGKQYRVNRDEAPETVLEILRNA